MTIAAYILLGFLVVCAVAVSFTRDPLTAVLIQLGFSTIMAVIWLMLESPVRVVDGLRAAMLFFSAFRRMGIIGKKAGKKE